MTGPDIGALRWLAEAVTDAERTTYYRFNRALDRWARTSALYAAGSALCAAVGDALGEAFGPAANGRCPSRIWSGRSAVLKLEFDGPARLWLAVVRIGDRAQGEHFADTPTAAVNAALDALAETHPTEAAALRAAVTFTESKS